MLDEAQVADLYASKQDKRKPAKGKGYVLLNTGDGIERQTIQRMGDYDFGSFEGKVGSIRRSRKGATRRVPNGSRKYVRMTNEVIAYKLTR